MSEEIKVVDETIIAKWVEGTQARYEARKLMTEAEMLNAQAKHHITTFWDMVATEHDINVRTGAWNFDEPSGLVTPMAHGGHPLQQVLGGIPPGSTVIIQQDGDQPPPPPGMVT